MGLMNVLDVGFAISRMKANQWKGREELESIQSQGLLRVVKSARDNVPHFGKALASMDVRGLEDLESLPIMEKEDVKHSPESFIHRGFSPDVLHRMRTGGSTGVPMAIYFNRQEGVYGSALRYHVLSECGFGPADRLAVLTHSKFITTGLQRLIYRISAIPPSERPERMLAALKAMRPSMLFSYPSILAILASLNLESSSPIRVQKGISSSEMLSNSARALIQKSFGCDIRNYYGSNESWALGWECEKGSMHLNSDSAILEVVGPDGRHVREGERGEVLITSLWRHSMPFIRYRLGDTASIGGKCRCGRGLHVIRSLDGRSAHMVMLPSGRRFAWSQAAVRMGDLEGLLRYQVIQEADGSLRVLAMPSQQKPCSPESIKALLISMLPEKMDIHVEFVGEIPRSGVGKMHEFVSRLNNAGAGPETRGAV